MCHYGTPSNGFLQSIYPVTDTKALHVGQILTIILLEQQD